MIQLIGYLATITTILSFTFKNILKLRIVSSIACCLWIIYGIYRQDIPVTIVNISVLLIHIYHFINYKKSGN
jgi:uncharacterized protein with PQ loop repeat